MDCFIVKGWPTFEPATGAVKFEFADPMAFAEWLDHVRPPVVQPSSALQRGEEVHRAVEAGLQGSQRRVDAILDENRRLRSKCEIKRGEVQSLVEDLAKEKARLDAVVTQNQELRAVARAHGEARERAEKDLAAVPAALRAKDVVAACKIVSTMTKVCENAETVVERALVAHPPSAPVWTAAERVFSRTREWRQLQDAK